MPRLRLRSIASPLLATTFAIGACSGGDTASTSDGGEGGTPITTRGMSISATIEAEDDVTAEVSVALHDGDPLFGTSFLLTGGDELRACVGMQCSPLTRDGASSAYEAHLPYAAETTYTISLARAAGASAPNSAVTLPVPFTILAPAPGLRVTDGDSVTVQWAPAGTNDVVDVLAETRCYHGDRYVSGFLPLPRHSFRRGHLAENVDSGTISADVDMILDSGWSAFSQSAPIVSCEIVIAITQVRTGTIDPSLQGGSVHGIVSRKVTLDYTPRP